MAYHLEALLGKGTLATVPLEYSTARLLLLRHGLQFIPLTRAFYAELSARRPVGQTPHFETVGEVRVASDLADLARQLSEKEKEPVAYVEAHFLGGAGNQSAVVWQEGQVLLAISAGGMGAIDQALRCLGIRASNPESFDEFDMVGLGRWRSTEAWLQEEGSHDRLEWEANQLVAALARAEAALRELNPQSPIYRIAEQQKKWAEQRLGELSQKERRPGASGDPS
jgi:hypothetical protein